MLRPNVRPIILSCCEDIPLCFHRSRMFLSEPSLCLNLTTSTSQNDHECHDRPSSLSSPKLTTGSNSSYIDWQFKVSSFTGTTWNVRRNSCKCIKICNKYMCSTYTVNMFFTRLVLKDYLMYFDRGWTCEVFVWPFNRFTKVLNLFFISWSCKNECLICVYVFLRIGRMWWSVYLIVHRLSIYRCCDIQSIHMLSCAHTVGKFNCQPISWSFIYHLIH